MFLFNFVHKLPIATLLMEPDTGYSSNMLPCFNSWVVNEWTSHWQSCGGASGAHWKKARTELLFSQSVAGRAVSGGMRQERGNLPGAGSVRCLMGVRCLVYALNCDVCYLCILLYVCYTPVLCIITFLATPTAHLNMAEGLWGNMTGLFCSLLRVIIGKIIFGFHFCGAGIELRTLHTLGKCSTTELHPQL